MSDQAPIDQENGCRSSDIADNVFPVVGFDKLSQRLSHRWRCLSQPLAAPQSMKFNSVRESLRLKQFQVVRLASIHEVDELHWDSINSDQDLFHTHRFIRSVEDAKVENSEFWYLLFYLKDELVATAVLSAFTISLDLFVGSTSGRIIKGLRRWFPGFLKINVLFCGLPVSVGQHSLVMRDYSQSRGIFALLAQEMSDICRAYKFQYLCVKEFLDGHTKIMDGLLSHGFFRANSIPYVSMGIRWPSFESYLSNLRHNYRRPIKLTLKKLGQARPVIETIRSTSHDSEYPNLIVGGAEACSPSEFYKLYLQVMERAEVKLETLNQPFFENLYANMKDDIKVLAMVKSKEVLGAAILTISEKTMTFLLVGLDYSRRDQYEVYFNLVYGIILLAIERGSTRLDLGQTSYWLKQRIGGVCIPEYVYIKANRWYAHYGLKTLRSVIFPEMTLLNPRAFRE